MQLPLTERRQEQRLRIASLGSLFADERSGPIPCHILDLSICGARILVDAAERVPDHFRLRLDIEDVTHDCVVIWRSGDEIGVK